MSRRRIRQAFSVELSGVLPLVRRIKREDRLVRELNEFKNQIAQDIEAVTDEKVREVLKLYRSEGGDDGVDDGIN